MRGTPRWNLGCGGRWWLLWSGSVTGLKEDSPFSEEKEAKRLLFRDQVSVFRNQTF
jgi:hypothetical protein